MYLACLFNDESDRHKTHVRQQPLLSEQTNLRTRWVWLNILIDSPVDPELNTREHCFGKVVLTQVWLHKKKDCVRVRVCVKLTGSSSLCVQTPLHCLCSMTCLMFINTGSAMQPDAKLKHTHTIKIMNTSNNSHTLGVTVSKCYKVYPV